MKVRKGTKAFTLIELLVVIAVIALLMAIVMPSLRKAREYAKKVICYSNLRQIGIVLGNYETDYGYNFREEDEWRYDTGSGDFPYEDQSQYQRDIMARDLLPDYKIFFCPGVRNVSYKDNYYLDSGVQQDSVANILGRGDEPVFWSTYVWLWEKGDKNHPDGKDLPTNPVSNGAILCDVVNEAFQYAMSLGNDDAQVLEEIFGTSGEIIQTVPHGNVLMKDLSVKNPADDMTELNQWLWETDTWAGMNY